MNGHGITPIDAKSSPSQIIARKGLSVWLHWSYTYDGDGRSGPVTVTFREQTIGFTSTFQPTVQTLAKRTDQNGALTLASSIPVPFNGRVEVISANSTVVIRDLQYNDSAYQFSSNVKVDAFYRSITTYEVDLRPLVSIAVNGMNVLHTS